MVNCFKDNFNIYLSLILNANFNNNITIIIIIINERHSNIIVNRLTSRLTTNYYVIISCFKHINHTQPMTTYSHAEHLILLKHSFYWHNILSRGRRASFNTQTFYTTKNSTVSKQVNVPFCSIILTIKVC